MKLSNNQQAFFALLRAGLWEKEVRLSQYHGIDYTAIIQLAMEQSVVGLITAGLEQVVDVKVPQMDVLQFIGGTMQVERRNKAMNEFVAKLITLLRKNDVYALLVKGQGIAQCYERPLWRSSGDIDLLLSNTDYEKAKDVLIPMAVNVQSEYKLFKHIGMTMPGGFVVELHGTLHSRLLKRVDKVIDDAQDGVFYGGEARSWMNGNTSVFLPAPDNDVIFVFTHILHHFFIEGVGLRQICDWCRLLWSYRNEIDKVLLEKRLCEAGLMSEWRAFAALAIDWLGMPVEAMPMYESQKDDVRWRRKGEQIMEFVLKVGNFGHNRETDRSKNYIIGKVQSAWMKMKDFASHAKVFPWDSVKFFCHFFGNGIELAVTNKEQ